MINLKKENTDKGSSIKKDRTEFYMLLPSIIVLTIISIFPVIYIVYISFFNFTFSFDSPTFCFLDNWIRVFKNDTFWASWIRTSVYVALGLSIEVVLGIINSLILYQIPRFKNIILTLCMLPIFVAPIVVGLLGRFMLNSTYGLYAWILQHMGVTTEIFGSTSTALLAIILMDIWEWTPLITLIVFAGLQSMDTQPVEAAEIDGASYIQKLRYIIIPLCSKIILIAILIRSMDIIRYVDKISIVTKGGPADATKISGWHLYEVAFRFQDFGQAAVLSIIMLILTIILSKFFINLMDKEEV